jgi:hypothetical protein
MGMVAPLPEAQTPGLAKTSTHNLPIIVTKQELWGPIHHPNNELHFTLTHFVNLEHNLRPYPCFSMRPRASFASCSRKASASRYVCAEIPAAIDFNVAFIWSVASIIAL